VSQLFVFIVTLFSYFMARTSSQYLVFTRQARSRNGINW